MEEQINDGGNWRMEEQIYDGGNWRVEEQKKAEVTLKAAIYIPGLWKRTF